MKYLFLDLFFAILYHAAVVFILSFLAMFVWNTGIAELFSSISLDLRFATSLAIMTGIYIIDLFVRSYINKVIAYKKTKQVIDELFKGKE